MLQTKSTTTVPRFFRQSSTTTTSGSGQQEGTSLLASPRPNSIEDQMSSGRTNWSKEPSNLEHLLDPCVRDSMKGSDPMIFDNQTNSILIYGSASSLSQVQNHSVLPLRLQKATITTLKTLEIFKKGTSHGGLLLNMKIYSTCKEILITFSATSRLGLNKCGPCYYPWRPENPTIL